jgi:probable rRNA maturation factor
MTTESSTNRVEARAENLEPPSWIDDLQTYAIAAHDYLGISGWELSVLVTDDEVMGRLNHDYRGKEGPTDVLSFAAFDDPSDRGGLPPDEPVPAGDIVISLPTVERQATELGVSPEEELRRVLVHGILHLAGHDHATNSFQEEPMLRLQESVLAAVEERIY